MWSHHTSNKRSHIRICTESVLTRQIRRGHTCSSTHTCDNRCTKTQTGDEQCSSIWTCRLLRVMIITGGWRGHRDKTAIKQENTKGKGGQRRSRWKSRSASWREESFRSVQSHILISQLITHSRCTNTVFLSPLFFICPCSIFFCFLLTFLVPVLSDASAMLKAERIDISRTFSPFSLAPK